MRRFAIAVMCYWHAYGIMNGESAPLLPLDSVAAIRNVGDWNPRIPHPLDLEATVTAVDPERKVVVVEQARAAVALALETLPPGIAPGRRIAVAAPDSAPTLTVLPHFPLAPSGRQYLRTFETPENTATVYVARIRGFVVPPTTGEYRFWIASDDSSELWLGDDEDPRSARVIASVPTWTAPKDWNRFPSQRTPLVRLEAGRKYYVEVLHVQRGGDDHLSVAWEGPGVAQQIVTGNYLMPWVRDINLDGPNAVPPTTGCLLREVWSNSIIPRASILMAPRRIDTTLTPYHAQVMVVPGGGFPVARAFRPGEAVAPEDEWGWCEMEGTAEFVGRRDGSVVLELSDGARQSQVVVPQWTDLGPERLLGQRIKVAGVAEPATDANGARVIATVRSPGPAFVTALGQWSHAQAYPLSTIASLATEDSVVRRNEPVRIRGRIARAESHTLVVADEGSIAAYVSEDGIRWNRVGLPVEVPMSRQLEVGLVVTSHSADRLERAVFDHVQGPVGPLTLASVGAPTRTGALQVQNDRYTLTGGGRDIWTSPDQFSFAHTEMVGAGSIVVRLAEFAAQQDWAKAGIMMRAGIDANAPFVDLVQTGAHGCCLQWRPLGNGNAPLSVNESHRTAPLWLKLERRFDSIRVTARHSVDLPVGAAVEVVGFVDNSTGSVNLSDAVCRPASPEADNAEEHAVAPRMVDIARMRSDSLIDAHTPFRIGGVVTFADFVHGRRYIAVQDQTGATFIWGQSAVLTPAIRTGQRVEVQFDPLSSPVTGKLPGQLTVVLGPDTLPTPLRHPAENALPRQGEAYRVEVDGIARAVAGPEMLELRAADAVFNVLVPRASAGALRRYIDARVKVRGVASTHEPVRSLLVPDLSNIEIVEEPVEDTTKLQAIPIAAVANNLALGEPLHRVKIAGTVTCVDGTAYYLQDASAGARVELAASTPLHVGDNVDAIGFADATEDGSLILSHALVWPAAHVPPVVTAVAATGEELLRGSCGAKLVTVRAVVSRVHTTQAGHTLELQIEHRICRATLPGASLAPSLPSGTIVSITGVCTLETALPDWIKVSASTASILPIRLLLRDASDIVVVQTPPGWAVKRTLLFGGVAGLVLGIAGAWIYVLRRRIAQRTADLEAAMKKLREEAQTSATLAERNRLAGEIHDSIEQSFSGVIFQLDTTAKRESCPPEIRAGIELARNMVAFSRQDVRHAVRNLHSPLLDHADLSLALRNIASHLTNDTLQTNVMVEGAARRLGSTVEHHILRVAQEAIANAAKHARARRVDVRLIFGESVVALSVRDDGCGFEPAKALARAAGHFGLRSLRGRAAQIHGELTIESTTGHGTTVSLRVPLATNSAS